MNVLRIIKRVSLAAIVIAFIALTPLFVSAITVGPAKIEHTLNPGDTVSGELFVKNEENAAKTFYPSYEKFTEQNGVKVFVKDESLLSSWIKTLPSITLQPGEAKRFPYTITVPKNAPPGGHFAIVWWSTNPPKTSADQQVAIQTRAGILVYVNIRGAVNESAAITDFSTKDGKRVFSTPNASFAVNIENKGNTYIKPTGTIAIKSLFGRVRDSVVLNEKGYQILPQSYRIIADQDWKGSGFYIGPYKAEVTMAYGENNSKQITETYTFWIMPWKTIVIVLIVLIVLIVGVKKYNKWLINKARADFNK